MWMRRLVIMVLVDTANGKQRHVPYRDSKLTFLLQVCLPSMAERSASWESMASVSPVVLKCLWSVHHLFSAKTPLSLLGIPMLSGFYSCSWDYREFQEIFLFLSLQFWCQHRMDKSCAQFLCSCLHIWFFLKYSRQIFQNMLNKVNWTCATCEGCVIIGELLWNAGFAWWQFQDNNYS